MQLHDALTLDANRSSTAGYLKARARSARAGVYDYLGSEVDPEGKKFAANDRVKVYRPPEEVFSRASLASFALKPITNDHPTVAVNATNWRDHARGTIIGAVQDGEYVGFDLAFMDAETVKAVDSGKRELSNGYSCDLSIEDGVAPDGTAYQAVQRNIRGNHVALVDRGRAGPECRVNDAAPTFALCDALPSSLFDKLTTQEKPMPVTMIVDGLTVDVSNAETAKATISTILAARDAATAKVGEHAATITARDATIVARDAEIVTLKQQLADAKLTPQQMRDAGKAYTEICDKAKAAGITVTDAMSETDIMRAVVDKGMGVAAKDYNDEHIAIAFRALTNGIKTADRHTAPSGVPMTTNDGASVRDIARAARY